MTRFILALILSGSLSGCAQAQSNDQVLGATLGGVLGYVFGDGSGHQKEIATGGAIAGYLLSAPAPSRRYYQPYMSRSERGFYEYCATQVPYAYRNDPEIADRWISGCARKQQEIQAEYEARAYQDGYQSQR